MKFILPVIAALIAIVQADIPPVPSCSVNCFLQTLGGDGCAHLDDFKCHCAKPELLNEITPCVKSACSTTDAANVTTTIIQTCASVGEPVPGTAKIAHHFDA